MNLQFFADSGGGGEKTEDATTKRLQDDTNFSNRLNKLKQLILGNYFLKSADRIHTVELWLQRFSRYLPSKEPGTDYGCYAACIVSCNQAVCRIYWKPAAAHIL